jgi:hypothetical protein
MRFFRSKGEKTMSLNICNICHNYDKCELTSFEPKRCPKKSNFSDYFEQKSEDLKNQGIRCTRYRAICIFLCVLCFLLELFSLTILSLSLVFVISLWYIEICNKEIEIGLEYVNVFSLHLLNDCANNEDKEQEQNDTHV